MMPASGLLGRLDAAGTAEAPVRHREDDPAQVLGGVARHLQDLFNVRQGSAMSCPDYGLPDFNDLVHRSPRSMETELAKAIKESIRRYEPRLTAVRVSHVPREGDPLSLVFQISARLTLGDKRRPVAFETVMTESGRMRVQV